MNAATEVEVRACRRVRCRRSPQQDVVLNATGYIVAAHKIEVASKVVGKVAWIGVDKGDKVKEGQVMVRLEDDEYRAQLQQAQGQLANLQARLAGVAERLAPRGDCPGQSQRECGQSRPGKRARQPGAVRKLVKEKVMSPRKPLDDAQARYDSASAHVASLQKTYELVRIGPRQEQIDAMRGQVEQAKGAVAFAETNLRQYDHPRAGHRHHPGARCREGRVRHHQLCGRAGRQGLCRFARRLERPRSGTRHQPERFRQAALRTEGVVTTDAFPDRKYEGDIDEISPEANRQKATVQVKVKILNPDDYLRPEMNASVAFLTDRQAGRAARKRSRWSWCLSSAVRDNAVFVLLDGRAVRRAVKVGAATTAGGAHRGRPDRRRGPDRQSARADLKDGDRVRQKA